MFKVAVSVPGITRQMIYNSTNANFPLFSYATQDIYKTVQINICAGPSLIFTRKHKVDETCIRENPDKVCKNIIGEDANALYVHALRQAFPTGCFVDRKGPNFKQEPATKFMSQYFWLDYLSEQNGVLIKHRLNNEGKKRIVKTAVKRRKVSTTVSNKRKPTKKRKLMKKKNTKRRGWGKV